MAARRRGRTFYEVLNVPLTASAEDIKLAYRNLAKLYHPDLNPTPGAEDKFKEIQEAHATLSQPWKRQLYDQTLPFEQAAQEGREEPMGDDDWRELWKNETPEEMEARRERYRRYAAGERNDLPPEELPFKAMAVTVAGGIGGIWLLCINAQDIIGFESDPHFTDPNAAHNAALVRSYFNPVTVAWERLPAGHEPPHVTELLTYYEQYDPAALEAMEAAPPGVLTVLNVPGTNVVRPVLTRDENGELVMHKNRRRAFARLSSSAYQHRE